PFSRKVDSIQIVFDNQQLVLPGESFRIGVTSYRNGKAKNTMGLLGGSVWWLKYKVDVTGGTDFGGKIMVNEKLVPSKGKYIGLRVYPRRQSLLQKELLIPLNYDTKIVYRPIERFDKAPGSQIKGEVEAEFNNGIKRVYDNLKTSKESDYFRFSPHGGNWNNGKFIIDPDFMNIQGHKASLVVSSMLNKSVTDTFAVLLDYRHAYQLHFTGESGFPGLCGGSGHSGPLGANGSDGQSGGDGGQGMDGPEVGVWVDLYHDSILHTDLLYVYAQNQWTGKEYRYLINPDGGRLEVSSEGGNGGRGGNGGNGGMGGQGQEGERWIESHIEKKTIQKPVVKKVIKKRTRKTTDANGKEVETEIDVEVEETVYVEEVIEVVVQEVKYGPGGPGGNGGWGGAGGYGGQGGNGGNIFLFFTEDARSYQNVIMATSNGGSGGIHGNGGSGGSGGVGGFGNPTGPNGISGQSGLSATGWASDGHEGKISIQPTEEFFFYVPKMEASQTDKP
ncbi:MAG: hypothetical protein ACM3O8_07985, partial [Methylococcaceae bacterium]